MLHRSLKVDFRDDLSLLDLRLASPLLVARSFIRATTSSIPGERILADASALAGWSEMSSSPVPIKFFDLLSMRHMQQILATAVLRTVLDGHADCLAASLPQKATWLGPDAQTQTWAHSSSKS